MNVDPPPRRTIPLAGVEYDASSITELFAGVVPGFDASRPGLVEVFGFRGNIDRAVQPAIPSIAPIATIALRRLNRRPDCVAIPELRPNGDSAAISVSA